MDAPSTQARPQAIRSASRNRRKNSRYKRSRTPATCRSRSLRQHVTLEPHPGSKSGFSQATPERRTRCRSAPPDSAPRADRLSVSAAARRRPVAARRHVRDREGGRGRHRGRSLRVRAADRPRLAGRDARGGGQPGPGGPRRQGVRDGERAGGLHRPPEGDQRLLRPVRRGVRRPRVPHPLGRWHGVLAVQHHRGDRGGGRTGSTARPRRPD